MENKPQTEEIIEIVTNRIAQMEQKTDMDAIVETSLQRIAREAAQEITTEFCKFEQCLRDSTPNSNEIASIIYKHFRDGKEL